MAHAILEMFGYISPQGVITVGKDDYDEEIRNEIPRITVKSHASIPIQLNLVGKGIHGIKEGESWAEVSDIEIEVYVPEIKSLKDRLKILFRGHA